MDNTTTPRNMIELSVSRIIPEPREKIWSTLADFGAVDKFNPMVRTSHTLNGKESGVGAERRCDFVGRAGHVTERIVADKEPEFISVELIDGTMPMKRSYAIFRLVALDAGTTRVVFRTEIEPKGGFLGFWLGKVLVVPMMRSKLEEVLQGLEHFLSTGQKLGEKPK